MKIFDLHCDTLFEALKENKSLNCADFHISLDKAAKYDEWIQCFAVFIPDEYRSSAAFDLFVRAKKKLDSEIAANRKLLLCNSGNDIQNSIYRCKAILTVEGGAALAGDLSNLDFLHSQGVKMMTLTWNDKNEIGNGCGVKNAAGLTPFGRQVVKKMESLHMIIDISHASDSLFYDVAKNTQKPFVASHSNSREICSHRRNLTDDQFQVVKSRNGLVGINFCKDFLNDKNTPNMHDIIRHVEHFLSLGGENIVALGSDFDGADIPHDLLGLQSMGNLYELFLKHRYQEQLVQDIFFNNAYNFFMKNCFN